MRTAWLAGFCLLASTQAHAAVATNVLALDMRDPRCAVQAAGNDEAKSQSARELRGYERQLGTMAKFEKFMKSRKWKPKVPIGEQMTPNQAVEFGKLQEETRIGLFASLLEAKRGRDIDVLLRMAETAKSMLSNFQAPKDAKSEAFALVGLLAVGRQKFQLSDAQEVDAMVMSQGKCTLQNALIAEAKRVLDSIDMVSGVHNASADMTALGQKYGAPIDRSKLDDADKLLYDRTTSAITTVLNRQSYYKDLLFIARVDAVSKLQQSARSQSQSEAPGDNARINVVWNAWMKEGKITIEQDELSRVVNYIGDRFPTEFMKTLPDNGTVN